MSGQCLGTGRDDEPRLRDEHAFLERQLAEAITLAEADDWQGFELKWEAFTIALEQHMQYEENQIFPAFAKSSSDANLETQRLRAEHQNARKEVKFLDTVYQVSDLFIEQLRYLSQALHAHREQEDRVFYPWLSALQPEDTFDGTKLVKESSSASNTEDPWENPLRHAQEAARSNR